MTIESKVDIKVAAICPNCQQPVKGKYCSSCGTRLVWEPLQTLTRYSDIIADKRCRKIIQEETRESAGGMSAVEFLQFAQLVLPGRMPLAILASLAAKAGKKLNIGRKDYGFRLYRYPFAYVVLALLTSMAKQSLVIRRVLEGEKSCLIEASIPSTIWNLEGKLEMIVVSTAGKTRVMMKAGIFGQWVDWGKTERLIDGILVDINKLCAGFQRNKEL